MNYDPTKALVYEFLRGISEGKPFLRGNLIVREVMKSCFPDWAKWKGDVTMRDVDIQVEDLMSEWQEKENEEPVVIEHKPDGSEAQELLGGAMEIRSPWSQGKSNNEDLLDP